MAAMVVASASGLGYASAASAASAAAAAAPPAPPAAAEVEAVSGVAAVAAAATVAPAQVREEASSPPVSSDPVRWSRVLRVDLQVPSGSEVRARIRTVYHREDQTPPSAAPLLLGKLHMG